MYRSSIFFFKKTNDALSINPVFYYHKGGKKIMAMHFYFVKKLKFQLIFINKHS